MGTGWINPSGHGPTQNIEAIGAVGSASYRNRSTSTHRSSPREESARTAPRRRPPPPCRRRSILVATVVPETGRSAHPHCLDSPVLPARVIGPSRSPSSPSCPSFPPPADRRRGPWRHLRVSGGLSEHLIIPRLCKVWSVQFGEKSIPYMNTYDSLTIRYPDPLIKSNTTMLLE
ncbi:hypothetical protein ACQ4PT_063731 [Festuca glaucescens]